METPIKKILSFAAIFCLLLFAFFGSYFFWNSAQNQKAQKERTQQIFNYYEKKDREEKRKQKEEENTKMLFQAQKKNQERYEKCLLHLLKARNEFEKIERAVDNFLDTKKKKIFNKNDLISTFVD